MKERNLFIVLIISVFVVSVFIFCYTLVKKEILKSQTILENRALSIAYNYLERYDIAPGDFKNIYANAGVNSIEIWAVLNKEPNNELHILNISAISYQVNKARDFNKFIDILYPSLLSSFSSDQYPEFGYVGYSSGTLLFNNTSYIFELFPLSRKLEKRSSFGCYKGDVSVAEGNYILAARTSLIPNSLNQFDSIDYVSNTGTLEFVISPNLVQTGQFSKLVDLTDTGEYQAYVLPFVDSCFNNKAVFFSINPNTNKIEKINFKNADGTVRDFIYMPANVFIPQIENNYVIENYTNEQTSVRKDITYTFDLNEFVYKEVN